MKKLLALLLALLMVVSMVACAAKEEAKEEKPADSKVEEKPAEDKKEEPKEEAKEDAPAETPVLTVGVIQNANTENHETNAFTQYLEESLGIDLEFVYFSSDNSEAITQLALMTSSNQELPDVIMSVQLDMQGIFEYGQDGYFIDIREYLEDPEMTPNFHWALENIIPANLAPSMIKNGVDPSSGAVYAFPYMQFSPNTLPMFVQFNKEWLDKAGMDVPATVDELYELLKFYAENDMNGNGEKDEIPMVGYPGYAADLNVWIINAFVYCNDSFMFNADDGKLWLPYTTDEYREAMIYLNKLVSEGLLSDLTYTLASSANAEMSAMLCPEDDVAFVGVISGQMDVIAVEGSEVLKNYVGFAPLDDETGLGGYRAYNLKEPVYENYITADCDDVELAVKFLDFFANETTILNMRWGPEGQGWEWLPEGSEATSVFGIQTKINVLDASIWSSANNLTWHDMAGCDVHYGIPNAVFDKNNNDGSFGYYKNCIFSDSYARWDADTRNGGSNLKEELVGTLQYNAEENEAVAEIQSMAMDYIKEARALFATGALDPNSDADWEKYLTDLENIGISTWLEIAQGAYDRMNG